MDIEINEVQEIIKNLESGGDLSIKEEKYLNVAKLCVQLAAERDAATLEYDYLNDQIEYWKNKSINITEQRNELAAENVALKDINAWCKTDAFKNMYREFKTADALGCLDVDCMHDAMLVAIMHAPETPATDRIVAGIKADGVEMFASYISLYNSNAERQAIDFAKQLREGANND